MATRYWVGGTGNWNDSTHWSATSGGVGGASVPTSSDDVIFDSNSGTGTVTVNAIANMRDCTFAQTQLIKLVNAAYPFNIFGNWTLCSNTYLNTSFTGTGYVYLKATTSVNITSNGCTRGWNNLYFDGIGGTWTNQDDWAANTIIHLTNGTWYTNDKTITCGLTGGSAILEQKCFMYCGSSTLNITLLLNTRYGGKIYPQTSIAYTLGGQYEDYDWNIVYQTVSLSSKTYIPRKVNYLYIIGAANIAELMLYGDGTVYYDLSITGNNSTTQRLLIHSSLIGTARTITCNGTITASNVDFRDIVGAGTANWDLSSIEGGSGDCGGNSGITFTPAQTQYFKHTLGAVNWSDATKWFSNYERTIAGRVPLPQDNAIFDENSFTGASTLNVNVPRVGNVYTSGITNIVDSVFSVTNTTIQGNSILNGFNSLSATYLYIIGGRTEYCGVNLPLNHNIVILWLYSLKIELLCNISVGTIRISDGGMCSFKSNNFKMNAIGAGYVYFYPGFNATDSFLDLGSSLIGIENVTTGYPFVMVHSNIPRSRINMNNATFFIRSNNAVDFRNNTEIAGITSSKKIIIDTPNAISSVKILNVPPIQFATDELEVTAGSRVKFSELSGFNINKLTAIGTPDKPITIGSTTPGSKYTLNITGTEPIETDYINITDCNVTQTNKFYAGVNSINGGNNTNVIFDYVKLPLNMNLYTLKIYDKVLTDEEVLQNYNATKSRYL